MVNKSQKHWLGSWREVTFLTPDTFLKPIKVVSTLFRVSGDSPGGETAVTEYSGLNSNHLTPLENAEWRMLKKHKTEAAARSFHAKTVSEVTWDA